MRGFGRSSAPSKIAAYSIFDTVGDMVALVAALGEAKVAIVGHDWGAPVASHAALFRPDLFTAVAGLSVPPPFRGRGRPPLRENGITNFYWQYFQPPGLAEAELECDVSLTPRTLLGCGFSDPTASMFVDADKGFLRDATSDRPLPAWLGEADLAFFTAAYRRTGFRSGLKLVPQHRPQLGADRAMAGCANPPARTVHRRRQGFGDHQQRKAHQRTGARVLPKLKARLIIDGAGHWISRSELTRSTRR